MKRIIALQGAPGTGKTTTIGILFADLKKTGCKIIKDKHKKSSRDFFVIVERNGVRIGISTYGDTVRQIRRNIDFFIQHSCEIIVCACHNRGTTVKALNTPGYLIEIVSKSVSGSRDDVAQMGLKNNQDAATLMSKL